MWKGFGTAAAGVFTIQQSSTTPPAGFTNFTRITTTTADASPAAGSLYEFFTNIEGQNLQDLQWGLSTAKTITISFQVRSSLTGAFSGCIVNSAAARSFPFSFSIISANVWQTMTITIPGDQSGTWLTTNGIGLQLRFDLGSGSNFKGAAGNWSSNNFIGVTSAVGVVATNAATLDITGVQLELGPIASSFEIRDYQSELKRCQRYYATSIEPGATISNFTTLNSSGVGGCFGYAPASNSDLLTNVIYPTTMRAAPNITVYSGANRTAGAVRDMTTGSDVSGFPTGGTSGNPNGLMYIAGNTLTAQRGYGFHYVADARL